MIQTAAFGKATASSAWGAHAPSPQPSPLTQVRDDEGVIASTRGACAPQNLPARPNEPSLWEIQKILISKKFVDLTHAFEPGIPHWPGFPNEKREALHWNGFHVESFTHVGQWGTHVDPPAHFASGLRTVDQISLKEMILPLVVIDVHAEVAKNSDYALSLERIKKWETEHGAIPPGAFVALRTDWSKRWPDGAAMQNKDEHGVAHYPGWSLTALRYLYEEREITASGHETTNTDPGIAATKDDYSLESYILGTNHYQIELLTNLDQVPETGAVVVVSFPKPKHGSGFPARVFAILPEEGDQPRINTNRHEVTRHNANHGLHGLHGFR